MTLLREEFNYESIHRNLEGVELQRNEKDIPKESQDAMACVGYYKDNKKSQDTDTDQVD